MSHHHETTTTTTTTTGSAGTGVFDNHGAGLPADYPSHNAYLAAATTGKDADTISTGSTARNFSTARMADGTNVLEKDFSRQESDNGYSNQHLEGAIDSDTALRQIRTAGSVSISPELFEKLYLQPQNQVKGELRKTFGNPTPIALIGFLLSLMPLSMQLMGWRGAVGGGAATIGWYYFAGGVLMLMGGIGEWILGNTFPFVVFSSFGAFWLGFAATLQPIYNAYGAFANTTTSPASTGLQSVGFNVGIGFFLITMGVLCFIYLICSIRTNLVFFMIFFCLVCNFGILTGAYFEGAKGNLRLSGKLTEAAGAFQFITCLFGWYIFFAIMLVSVDFPLNIPIVDLSTMVKGASEKKKINHVE
ncbi:hypothetical protein P153DRAFT_300732 [Dothidotthia symphoricarpi CBS 119687]|uniref:GPR1/FUN34/YaaH-class plasma membrane protein n=1 Tax=Dothidotthia symphoricarpi CBS 119687 TaxID=1392245 RepID=A0A6A6A303_9PLEO|nr:uncharacterized protein P153DRAFT_300732 [Dothidotthia symphoricarpi CBS 119687]KAF2124961.1 hypothetical protein P153DRAFT_300732 [Dothidotthia symphoricarpi CBS 119687]